jgi:hypothetical protein
MRNLVDSCRYGFVEIRCPLYVRRDTEVVTMRLSDDFRQETRL